MRTKKIALNILCDILPYILIGIVGLIKVNFLIKYIGDVGNGYYQVINQIISYVFLAQAGFGDAVIYALYKPFAEKNKHDINAIYSGARKVFKIIGLVILGLIILVSGALYLFYGFEEGFRNSAIICFAIIASSYLISYFGKTQTYMTVLSAAQEKYIFSMVFNSVKLACDIAIVYVTYRFQTLEAIAITILIAKIIEEIIMRIVVSRKYKWLKEIDEKNTSMVGMMKDLIWVQIGFLMLNNIDSILLMGFVGPVVVSIYTSYNFVLRYLNEVASRVELGAVYSFGNVFAQKEDEKVFPLFKEFLMLFIILGFGMSLTFLLGIRSFVTVWINEANYILDYLTIVFFSLSLFLNIIYYPLLALVNANGLFKNNKRHTFICAFTNLILSIILIIPFGMNGILLATAFAFLINIFLKTRLISIKVLETIKHSTLIKYYVISIVCYILAAILLYKPEMIILSNTTGLLSCIIMLLVVFIVITLLIFSILYLFNEDTRKLFDRIIGLLKNFVKKLKK